MATHEDAINYRVVNEKIGLRRTDPYGFWEVTAISGRVPAELEKERFTNLTSARQAVDHYLKTSVEKKVDLRK